MPTRTQPKNVLLLDDDPDIHQIARKILEAQGWQVTCVVKSYEALRAGMASVPDLIITDLQLEGGESGFDFIEAVKATPELARVPLIVLSSLDDRDSVFRATSLGASDYLLKPIRAPGLLRKALQSADFLRVELPPGEGPKLRAELQAVALGLGEGVLRIESSMLLDKETLLTLGGSLIDELNGGAGELGCLFRTRRKFGRSQQAGRFISDVGIIGASEAVAKAVSRRVRGK